MNKLVMFILGIPLLVSVNVAAQDCSDITKFGIFDVRHTNQDTSLIDDIVHWLTVNEYTTENDARNASLRAGIVIPVVNIPINADGTYGDSHSSSWSKATAEYLQAHHEVHEKVSQDFKTANPQIVAAWQACVTQASGLLCWARQTDNKNEIQLNIEVRPISLPLAPLKVTRIDKSPNFDFLTADWHKQLNVNVTPLLLKRAGASASDAGNFTVETDNSQYRCSAHVPSLPPPAPVYVSITTPKSIPCVVGRLDFTGEGPKIGDKHLFGVHCHAPNPITGIQYLGCYDTSGHPNSGACPWLERHEEYDLPVGPYPKGTDVDLRFATDSSDNIVVKFNIFYNETTQKCTANCNWQP